MVFLIALKRAIQFHLVPLNCQSVPDFIIFLTLPLPLAKDSLNLFGTLIATITLLECLFSTTCIPEKVLSGYHYSLGLSCQDMSQQLCYNLPSSHVGLYHLQSSTQRIHLYQESQGFELKSSASVLSVCGQHRLKLL